MNIFIYVYDAANSNFHGANEGLISEDAQNEIR